MAVTNMAEVIMSPWNAARCRKEPIRPAVPSSAQLPNVWERDCTIGHTMPPARAVFDGMAGESTRSVAMSEYARPSVFLPNFSTKI